MNTFPLNMQSMPMPGMNNIPMQPQTRNASGPGQPNSTLYVGNLDSDLDEQRLYEYFSHYGPVNNVRIMRDLYSGESRGFAFVNYAQAVDAKRAKLVLNHTKVQDNEIRISFKRNPADIDQKANLYISNLDTKCGSRELEEMCAEHGLVVSCIVREDARGGSLGYGYVQFENEKGAQACIQGLNGQKLYEKEISVQVFVPRSKRTSPIQRNNLYLKNFPVSFTEEQVKEFINKSFSEFGSIESVGIFLDAKTNRHYAFVAFKQGEEARNAVQGLNGHDFGEDKLYVDFAQQKGQRRKMLKQKHMKYKNETNLYIRSLKPGVTEAQFRAAFEKYGTINSICLKKHSFPQRSQQQQETPEDKELAFGFVNFPNVEEAKNAFTEGKKDQDILDLIDESHNEKTEFIFYAQPAGMRKQYLRMIKKNFKATQMMQNNLLMMTQNAMKFMRMNNGGKNNFRPQGGNRGPKFSGKRGMRDNNMMGNMPFMGGMPPMNPMNMMMNNMGMNPQMQMMMQQQQQNMMMNPMMMQQQMMQQQNQNAPATANPGQQLLNQTAPQQAKATSGPQPTGSKDVAWLANNLNEFEQMSQHEKKNILGTLMYNKIYGKAQEALVPKITGMLIDLDVLSIQEIVEILSDDALLQERINEARNIIEDDNNGN